MSTYLIMRNLFLYFMTFLLVPQVAFAAPQDLPALVTLFISLIDSIITVLFALAVLGFFWGLAKYMLSVQDSAKIEEGRKLMIWGIIALFVMFSIFGILRILKATFLDSGGGSAPIEYTIEA